MDTCVCCGGYCREGEMICLQCQHNIKNNKKEQSKKKEKKNMTLVYYIIGFIILLAVAIEKLFESRILKITLLLLFCTGFILGSTVLYQLLSLSA